MVEFLTSDGSCKVYEALVSLGILETRIPLPWPLLLKTFIIIISKFTS